MLVNHTILPHCWVCGVRFTDSNPPGPANKEVHHIVPQQAGGTDGPTVTLCDTHHALLHKIALAFKSKSGRVHWSAYLKAEPPAHHQKLMWLAGVVYNAFEAVKNDPNKRVFAVMALSQVDQKRLEALKKVYPKAKSREAVLKLALDFLYSRHFTE